MEIISAPGMAADPFAGGAYAVPTGAPISVAFGDPVAGSGPVLSGPTPSGGPVYMAPQVIGSPGCNCNQSGAPVIDPSMMGGAPMGSGYEIPLGAPSYGGMPMYGDPNCGMPSTGCCLTDGCLAGGCLDGLCSSCVSPCDPCGTVGSAMCDPCQQPGVVSPGVVSPGGIYHGAGGAPRCGWSAGFSWVFLKPFYGSNSAFSVITPSGGSTISNNREFDHSLNLSPRVFVEYVGHSDTGLRATWFGFENDSDAVNANVPAGGLITPPVGITAVPGETVHATSGFDLDTIDLDLTHRFRVRQSLFNLGGGVRWAGYQNSYQSTVTGPVVGSAVGNASRQFHGIGPTLFAEWRRPIGTSPFSLLANVRGSMLYGSSKSNSYAEAFGTSTSFNSKNDDFVAIGESQLGGEWSAWVSRRTVLFVQVAWETQYWLGVGTAFDRNDDLGLFGFNTTVGLEW
jgi:hypothetical protein